MFIDQVHNFLVLLWTELQAEFPLNTIFYDLYQSTVTEFSYQSATRLKTVGHTFLGVSSTQLVHDTNQWSSAQNKK
jgi:hypothetical protein